MASSPDTSTHWSPRHPHPTRGLIGYREHRTQSPSPVSFSQRHPRQPLRLRTGARRPGTPQVRGQPDGPCPAASPRQTRLWRRGSGWLAVPGVALTLTSVCRQHVREPLPRRHHFWVLFQISKILPDSDGAIILGRGETAVSTQAWLPGTGGARRCPAPRGGLAGAVPPAGCPRGRALPRGQGPLEGAISRWPALLSQGSETGEDAHLLPHPSSALPHDLCPLGWRCW